jgi:hypothetical protein
MAVPAAGDDLTANALQDLLAGLIDVYAADNSVATQQTRSNNTFGDLTTPGPSVTVTSRGTKAWVFWGALVFGSVGGAPASGRMTIAISGNTVLAAAAANGIFAAESAGLGVGGSGIVARRFTITPGPNTYTCKYNNIAANGTSAWQDRYILVVAP